MSFAHEEYKTALIKILDMAKESHWHYLHHDVVMQLDQAKTYLWISSVIGSIAMFLVKDSGVKGFNICGISWLFPLAWPVLVFFSPCLSCGAGINHPCPY